jgi:hypothetical protein
LSGWGLAKTSAQNITKNDLIDFFGIEIDGLKSSLDGKATQLRGAEVGDFSQEGANGCSLGSNDVDGTDFHEMCLEKNL